MKHILLILLFVLMSCKHSDTERVSKVFEMTELTFHSDLSYENPYTDLNFYAKFVSDVNDTLVRPGFWYGDQTWKIRFTPVKSGIYSYTTHCSDNQNNKLHRQTGKLIVQNDTTKHAMFRNGFLQISSGKRNVLFTTGKPFFMIGDTPWGLPFRATTEMAKKYAADRQQKGYNTALLMTVQPDMHAEGPDKKGVSEGFTRGFFDLENGHINNLNPEYFTELDTLIVILHDHGIVPVYQPVFQGFGWKGLEVLGRDVDPQEYTRYCKYLLARYGAWPAMWLVSGDNTGMDPCIEPAGEMFEQWDAYQQPTGIHYNPFDDYCPENQPEFKCFHENKVHQDKKWLDFQWCQTGHGGKNILHKVEKMYENKPLKAIANGETTYEGMGGGKHGLGWWQGDEAWQQLMSGGTMGVVYGAASLWQWKYFDDEPGWTDWASAPVSWEKALEFEGSRYVGYMSMVFEDVDFIDMEKRADLTDNEWLLANEGKFYISYMQNGGQITIYNLPEGLTAYNFDPVNAGLTELGKTSEGTMTFELPVDTPSVLVIR